MSEKRDQNVCFFVISHSLLKLPRFWWHLVHRFLNKLAAKSFERFPPHLKVIYTKLWNLKCSSRTCSIELLEKESAGFIPRHLWPLNVPDLNPVDYSVCQEKVCKRIRCTKHASLIWTYRRRHWRMAATMTTRRDPAGPTPFSVAVSVRPYQWYVFCTP